MALPPVSAHAHCERGGNTYAAGFVLFWRKADLRKLPPGQDRASFDPGGRVYPTLLLHKREECAGRDPDGRVARLAAQGVELVDHAARTRFRQARHRQMGLSHQQEQVFVAVDAERLHRLAVIHATKRKVE